ncbi:hypothetical protein JHK86_018147 [Glycine max]|nr:hypothetical protein JHK86_018147 [Glycine max]
MQLRLPSHNSTSSQATTPCITTSRVSLTPFDQGYKNTTFLQAVFEGQSVIILKPKQLGEYKEETSVGIYNDSAVDLDLRIRAKFGRIKCRYFNPRLSVPLALNEKKVTLCEVKKEEQRPANVPFINLSNVDLQLSAENSARRCDSKDREPVSRFDMVKVRKNSSANDKGQLNKANKLKLH